MADSDMKIGAVDCYDVSEPQPSAEPGPLNVLMDMFSGDRLLDYLPDAEGGIARGVEVAGRGVECTLFGAPGLDFLNLHGSKVTWRCLSTSEMLMM